MAPPKLGRGHFAIERCWQFSAHDGERPRWGRSNSTEPIDRVSWLILSLIEGIHQVSAETSKRQGLIGDPPTRTPPWTAVFTMRIAPF
jgi:hypothetical protein